MNQQCFQDSPDIDWLFNTHLQPFDDVRATTVVAILYGNEDAPTRVECFAVNHYQAAPIVFIPNEWGNLVREICANGSVAARNAEDAKTQHDYLVGALSEARAERDLLKARIAQVLEMSAMLNKAELTPHGDTFNDAVFVLEHGPFESLDLDSHSGDSCFTFGKVKSSGDGPHA